MLYFQYSSLTKDTIDLNTWWDQVAYYFTKIFVEGSKTSFLELINDETAKASEVLKNGSYLDAVKYRMGFSADEYELIFWLIGIANAFVLISILGFFSVGTFILFGMAV